MSNSGNKKTAASNSETNSAKTSHNGLNIKASIDLLNSLEQSQNPKTNSSNECFSKGASNSTKSRGMFFGYYEIFLFSKTSSINELV